MSTTPRVHRAADAAELPVDASLHSHRIGNGVFVVDEFLSQAECQTILDELDFALWRPSLTYTKQPSGLYENRLTPFRVSETAHQHWFTSELNELLTRIEGRIEELVGLDRGHLESWQATRYRPGGKFDYHLDSGYWTGHWAAERVLSFVLYLDTPEEGGGTDFRALGTYVEARGGRLLVWSDLLPSGNADHKMIHASTPVVRGKKTTLVTWLRQKSFRGHS